MWCISTRISVNRISEVDCINFGYFLLISDRHELISQPNFNRISTVNRISEVDCINFGYFLLISDRHELISHTYSTSTTSIVLLLYRVWEHAIKTYLTKVQNHNSTVKWSKTVLWKQFFRKMSFNSLIKNTYDWFFFLSYKLSKPDFLLKNSIRLARSSFD